MTRYGGTLRSATGLSVPSAPPKSVTPLPEEDTAPPVTVSAITSSLRSSTGMNISDGPPERLEPPNVVSGPIGPEGGTPVVPIAYFDWPPVDPAPNTLYLRLAP